MYDFPASPSVGTLFAPAGGPTWRWSGTTWTAVSPAGLVQEAPNDGQNYVRRNGVWVLAPGTAEAKNRIVNPAMQISQENGNTVSGANGYYNADQWLMGWGGTGFVAATARGSGPTPFGSQYMVAISINTAKVTPVTTDYLYFNTIIEGVRVADFQWGTAAAKPAILRFCIYSSYAGTFNVALNRLPSYDRHFVKSFTVAAGEVNTYKYVTIVIPGDTTAGTWNKVNAGCFDISFPMMAGPTYSGATDGVWEAGNKYTITGSTNGAGTVGNAVSISDVGLYLDPQNTGIAPPWQMPDEAQELIACKRYWALVYFGTRSNATYVPYSMAMAYLPAAMRGNPAFTHVPGANRTNIAGVGFTGLANVGVSIGVNAATAGDYYIMDDAVIANARM